MQMTALNRPRHSLSDGSSSFTLFKRRIWTSASSHWKLKFSEEILGKRGTTWAWFIWDAMSVMIHSGQLLATMPMLCPGLIPRFLKAKAKNRVLSRRYCLEKCTHCSFLRWYQPAKSSRSQLEKKRWTREGVCSGSIKISGSSGYKLVLVQDTLKMGKKGDFSAVCAI